MSVSNELYLNLKANNKDECAQFILKLNKEGNFSSIHLNKKFIMLVGVSNDKLYDVLDHHDYTKSVSISTTGPYGHFELFDGLYNILVETCKEIPNVEFDGVLNSIYEVDGSERIIEFSYKKKTLKFADSQYFQSHDEDMYLKYVCKKLSYKRFTSLFKLDRDEFDEGMYEEVVLGDILEGSFFEMDYDEIMEILPDSKLKEEKFDDVMEKIEELEILSYEDYVFEVDGFEPKRKDWVKHTIKI